MNCDEKVMGDTRHGRLHDSIMLMVIKEITTDRKPRKGDGNVIASL